jgi:hypothetical protein
MKFILDIKKGRGPSCHTLHRLGSASGANGECGGEGELGDIPPKSELGTLFVNMGQGTKSVSILQNISFAQ